ncbi:MAG: hypothetical protein K2J00_07925 [Bacteroidaceae bacterium]|nr:hypothetical protein [Bacteroidaceae bacterium]
MKNSKGLLVAGVMAMAFTSCAHYTVDGPVMGISSNSINTYVAADLDYKSAKRISADVETKKLFGFINLSRNGDKQLTNTNRYKGLSKPERQALYRAKVNNNVDIIMEPEFTVEKHSWFFGAYKTRKVNVKGWGVNMKGIKEDAHGQTNCTGEFNQSGIGKIFK